MGCKYFNSLKQKVETRKQKRKCKKSWKIENMNKITEGRN